MHVNFEARKHVELLGVLYVISGALSLLIGLSLLALAGGAFSIMTSAPTDRAELAAALTAISFVTIAGIAAAWGAVSVLAGLALRRHRPWARPVGLAVAVLDLFVLPFGTALGIYSLWVLLANQSRDLFHPHAAQVSVI